MSDIRPLASLAVAAALLAVPSAASAAVIEHTAGGGPANEDFLVYSAAKGERNRLTVSSGKHGIVFDDRGARISRMKHDFGGCTISHARHRASCNVPADLDLVVRLGDRADTLRFKGTNAGKLGPAPRTEVSDAATLRDQFEDMEGANLQHAFIEGGPGNDVLQGTNGHDVIEPGAGRDRVDAGAGDDQIRDTPDRAVDRLLGGRGIDTIDGGGKAALTIDLAKRTFAAGSEVDTFGSIERARGGDGNDTLRGTAGADGLFGESGSDTLDGRGGSDYLSGDLPQFDFGVPGVDTLLGGAGDDILDGREGFGGATPGAPTPTDKLICGAGADRIVARQDDLADATCESSAWGTFFGDSFFDHLVHLNALSGVQPVARAADGAPTYSIACGTQLPKGNPPCNGRVLLESPPVAGSSAAPALLGSAQFTGIAAGARQDVAVTLTDAGKLALAAPGALAAVHVQMGSRSDPPAGGPDAEFGWQQQLGP